LAFTGVVSWWFDRAASGEYISGFLIEKSLSIDNVFVWALILGYFKVPMKYQHRVLFWGIFGALALRAIFIFAGVTLIERFDRILYVFGAFLLYTAAKLTFTDNDHVDPGESKFLKIVNRFVPSTDDFDGQKLFTKMNGKWLARPLLAALLLIEVTDVIFAVDSVPAVLAVSNEQFIVFALNAFAIVLTASIGFSLKLTQTDVDAALVEDAFEDHSDRESPGI
jgi:tellurite resistance protein TerC